METVMGRTCRTLLTACWALTLTAPDIVLYAQDVSTDASTRPRLTRELVLKAWEQLHDDPISMVFEAQIDHLMAGRGSDRIERGPLADRRAVEDRVLKMSVDYAIEGRKVAITVTDEQIAVDDHDRVVATTFATAFDEKRNTELVGGPTLVWAGIREGTTPDPAVKKHLMLLPLRMSLEPSKTLTEQRFAIKRLSVEDAKIDVNGIECRRVKIPGPRRGVTATIDVDPARGLIPIQWQTTVHGKTTMSVLLEYDGVDANPMLQGWTIAISGADGGRRDAWQGHVRKLEFNGDVDDKRFTIKFPVGTRVAEEVDGKMIYYIQEAKGKRAIDAKEYDRSPQSKPVGASKQ